MLSVILPLKSEKENDLLKSNLQTLSGFKDIQVLPVIKQGSCLDTVELLTSQGFSPLLSDKTNRAARINDGVEAADSNMILVIHPRSQVDPEGLRFLQLNNQQKIWGGFTHQFDLNHPVLRFTSWYSNQVRAKRRGIVYLDHCIFFNKSLLAEPRPFPEKDIFEDTLMSLKLRRLQAPLILDFLATTSAVRFQKNGVLYQSALNQVLKLAYLAGASDKTMNRIYERNLDLN